MGRNIALGLISSFSVTTAEAALVFSVGTIITTAISGAQKNKRPAKQQMKRKKKHGLFYRLFIGPNIAYQRKMDQRTKAMTAGLENWLSLSGPAEQSAGREKSIWERSEADKRARDRWEAQNSQKWHEYNALDQAKKGHPGGAAYHSNQADYYRNKSRNL